MKFRALAPAASTICLHGGGGSGEKAEPQNTAWEVFQGASGGSRNLASTRLPFFEKFSGELQGWCLASLFALMAVGPKYLSGWNKTARSTSAWAHSNGNGTDVLGLLIYAQNPEAHLGGDDRSLPSVTNQWPHSLWDPESGRLIFLCPGFTSLEVCGTEHQPLSLSSSFLCQILI